MSREKLGFRFVALRTSSGLGFKKRPGIAGLFLARASSEI